MVDPIWWDATLSVISLGVGAVFVHGLRAGTENRAVAGAHALMALGMAGMFSPWGDPVPAPVLVAVFGVTAAWFLAVRLRAGAGDPATHTAVGCAAMTVMYLGGQHDPGPAATGHAGHHGAAAAGAVGLVGVGVSLLLIGYFLWHAWLSAGRLRDIGPVPGAGRPPSPLRTLRRATPQAGPVAHVVMDVLMALMFAATV